MVSICRCVMPSSRASNGSLVFDSSAKQPLPHAFINHTERLVTRQIRPRIEIPKCTCFACFSNFAVAQLAAHLFVQREFNGTAKDAKCAKVNPFRSVAED